jgi:uncharacterized RDD family membrane protein YckC
MVDAPIDTPLGSQQGARRTILERSENGRRRVAILTPEGVELVVEVAERGERAGAFLLDALFVIGVVVALFFVALFSLGTLGGYAIALWVVLFFLIRTFYFSFFELAWRGRTPGKRLLKIRVIDRAGGPLKPSAVVVRNLVRELEVFLPLTLLAMPASYGEQGVLQLLLLTWVGIFMLMPLFNKQGLRVGDMVAGTLVVAAPKAALLPDLVTSAAAGQSPVLAPTEPAHRFTFTPRQLEFYGIYELQTLEAVLRRADPHAASTRREIAERIRRKIGWISDDDGGDLRFDGLVIEFLQDFYVAQRARLEHKMLFGKRRKDKHDTA